MDEESWTFFCNNSPRLVEKKRPKTPIQRISSRSPIEAPKSIVTLLKKPKKSFRTSDLSSIAVRASRDNSVLKPGSKSNNKLFIKLNTDIKDSIKPVQLKRGNSPLRLIKKNSSKKLSLIKDKRK